MSLLAQMRKCWLDVRSGHPEHALAPYSADEHVHPPRRARRDPRGQGAGRRPRPPDADALVGNRGLVPRGGRRAASRRRAAVRQGRASPEDRLVQGARDDEPDRIARGRPAPARRDHDVGRQCRAGLRVGGTRGRGADDRRHGRRGEPDEGRRMPRLRGRGRARGCPCRRGVRRARADPRRPRAHVHPPVRGRARDGRSRVGRSRDPRGPARRRCRRRGDRRRRAHLGHRRRAQGATAGDPGLWGRAHERGGDDPGIRSRCAGRDPAPNSRRRLGRAVRRRADPRDVPPLPRRDRPARRPRHPVRRAVRPRADEAGARAGRCGRAGGGPSWPDPDRRGRTGRGRGIRWESRSRPRRGAPVDGDAAAGQRGGSGVTPPDEPEAAAAQPGPVLGGVDEASGQAKDATAVDATAVDAISPPPEPEDFERGPVGAREILGRGFDLNVAAAKDVRSSAVLIGLLTLAAVGPIAAIVLAIVNHFGGFDVVVGGRLPEIGVRPLSAGVRTLFNLTTILGALCVIALAIDSQLLAVIVIASRASNRPFVLRRALELIRLRFWRLLRANVIIAIILFIPRQVVERTIAPQGVATDAQFVVLTLIGIVLSIPFAYVAAWIMLGPVGAREAVRRSWRLARTRPSLAIVIAVINVLFQTIALFAAGAGLDVLARVAVALNLERATGVALFLPLGLITLLAIAAAGSLVLTIAALTAAPQVVAFLRVTGVTNGLDVLNDPGNPFATPRTEPLVSRGMKAFLMIEAILAALTIVQIV